MIFWLALILCLTLLPPPVMSMPAGGRVAAGTAVITQPNGQTLNINQLTDKAIINWKGFSINVNELVKFAQPSSNSVVLNRVTGVDPSSILGNLIANGRVFIVNPNGVFFGPNSVVDVAGLLATTLNINDNDFLAGKYNFSQDPNKALSYVINRGEIKIADNGFVFLVAPGVVNEGLIIANLGKAVMASGQKLAVDFMGDGLITFAIEGKILDRVLGPDGTPLNSAVNNNGTIRADGGQVVLTAKASSEIFSSVVNNSGVIEARSLVNRGGVIRLEGSDPVANTGEIGWQSNLGKVQNADGAVINTGKLDVSASATGAAPGQVTLSGQMAGSSGTILARGAEGSQGGRVLITSTDKTVLTSDSQIDTSSLVNSSAGNVVVWSDKDTVFRGTIQSKGGQVGGNGGQIEVSGHENLNFTGQVNALAPAGTTGSLLLDPQNITVANGGSATLAEVNQFSDTPGTDQTIAPATINAAAANVVLQANNDITVANAIAVPTAGRTLTMQAGRDINIGASVSTTNGAITLTANDSAAAATAANRSAGTGNINMAGGTTLSAGTAGVTATVGSSTTPPFSPGNITLQNVTGGNIQITSPKTVNLNGAINAGSGAITLTAETININDSLTSTGALTLNPVTAAGNLTVSSSSASNLSNGFSSITIGNAAGTGNVTVNALTVSDPLTIRSPTTTGTVTVNGPITGLGNGSVTLTAGTGTTPITLNDGITTAGNAITLNDNVGLGTNVTLDSTNGGGSPAGATIGVTGTINGAQALTLNSGTAGNVTLSGAIGNTQPLQSLTVTSSNALTVPAVTTTGDIQLNAQNAVTLNGAVNAGSGTVTINANSNGAGAESFTMTAGSSITTTDATANAVQINVNAAGGGTGTAALRGITTGSGGTLTVATNTGGNATGGDITQTAGTLLNVGAGTINLTTPPITGANIGSAGANILTTADTITASTGTNGIFITESDGANLTATATGGGPINLTSTTGALNIAGATSTGSGAITLTAETVNINDSLTSTGALTLNPVTAAGNLTVSSSSASNLSNGFSSITIGNAAGTGNVTVNALTVSDPLTIRSPTTTGTVTVNGPITGLGNGSVTLTAGTGTTPITLNDGITTAGNAITLNDNVGLGTNVTLDSTNGGGSPAGATIGVTGTINGAQALTLNSGTAGNVTLSGAIGNTQPLQSLTVTSSNALTVPAVTTTGDIQLNAQNAVTLNGAVNAGSGTVTINANSNGAGVESFTMNAGSSITTTDATANAVQINVNAAGGGTGTAALRGITTGSGGTLTVATNTGGNATGGDITQTAGTLLNVGAGTINLTTPPITGANIGSAGANILTTADTITASTGTNGIFITESDGANLTATATGGGPINLTSTTGALNIAGATSTGSGAITLTAETVNINDSLTSTGALTLNPVTAAGNLTVSSSSASNLSNGFSSITIGNAAGTGNVTVNALTVSDPLTIRSPTTTGTVTVNGPITGLGNGSVTLTAGTGTTPITLNDGITTAGNAITLNDNVGLGTNVTLDSTNGGGSPAGATIGVTGTINGAQALTLNSGTAGNVTLSGAIGNTQPLQSLTVTSSNALTVPAVTTTGDIQLNAQNAVTLNGAVNAGSGTVTINANSNGAGVESFTMNAGSSITTTDATANAVQINVNAAGGGTGTAALRGITTGSGGTLTVATNTGGNATGGDITQTAGTLLNVGAGTINLTTPPITGANIGSAGANILTTADTITASTGASGIFVSNQTGVDLAGIQTTGPFSLTANGPITGSGTVIVGGTATLTAGAANNITLSNAANDFSTVAITSGNNVTLADGNALNLAASTISGILNVTAAGTITDSGNLIVTGNTTLAAGAGNDITLNSAGNNFSTVGVTSGRNVTLADTNALDLGTSTVSGTLNVMTNGSLTQSGPLNVTGVTTLSTGTANDITLDSAGNNFSTVAVNSGNSVALTDITALDLGASTISGALNVVANGLISQSGALTVAGNASFDTTAATTLGSVSLNNGGALTLGTSTIGGTLALATTAGDLTLAAGQTLTVAGDANLIAGGSVNLLGTAQIGGTQAFNGGTGSTFVLASGTNLNALPLPASGNITVNLTGTQATFAGAAILPSAVNLSNPGNNFGGTVSVTTTSPAFTGSVTDTYNLAQTSTVSLNPGQALTVTDLGGTAGKRGNITLDNPGNNLNSVNFTGGDIAWQQANAISIGSASANLGTTSSGALTITANGPITQTGLVTAAGITTLNATGGNIALSNVANDFNTVSVSSGNNVTLVDANALNLAASAVTGNLNVTTNGPLTQSNPLTVAGTTTLAAGSANNITLDNAANDFSTVAVNSGRNVALTDANTIDLGASTISGTLDVSAGGAVTQSAALNVAGPAMFIAGASNDINLGNASNDFNTVAITSGRNVTVQDSNAVNLGASTMSGTLNVTTDGNLTQSGALVVTGLTTLSAGAGDITLTNPANNFNTVAISSGANVTLVDGNALDLGGSTISGALNVATSGPLTQSGPLTIVGVTTLAAGTGNDIALSNPANNFSSVAVTSANNVNLADANALALGTSNVSGNLNVTTGGTITDSGNIVVAGITTLAAGSSNDITLDSAGNNFSTVGVTSGRNVTLADANALDLATSTVSGALNVTTNGALTQSGALNVTGATTLSAGAANDITLNNASNDFSTVAVNGANNVTLADANTIDLGASTVSGTLNITTNGALTQSGTLTVAGPATLAAGSGNDITLNNAGNDFSTVTVTNGNNVSLRDANNISLGTSTVSGDFSVAAGGAIVDGDGTGINVTASSTSLTAATNVGSAANPLETAVGTLNATSNAGGVYIAEADGLTVNSVVANGGNVTISNSTGDMVINAISATGGIDLLAAGGSIFDGNGTANNLTAVADSNLRALGGVIGLSTDPIEVNINPGLLGVAATGQIGGVSVYITGTVLPTNALTLLNSPPGEVIFNSQLLSPSPIDLPNLIGIAAELNPQQVNENDYVTYLLLDVLGEDFFKARPLRCKLDDSLQAKLDSNLCTEDDR